MTLDEARQLRPGDKVRYTEDMTISEITVFNALEEFPDGYVDIFHDNGSYSGGHLERFSIIKP
jgi:hypothetical protein